MRVTIDSERCEGHGRCYSLAPDLFEPDEIGNGVVVVELVPSGLEDRARLAAHNCPEMAIDIVED